MADDQAPCREHAVDSGAFYDYFIPYIERAHARNVRGLKAGIWLLFLLPFILVAIQILTGASRIVFLIFWIVAMFIIAAVLIYAAYSDNDLKKMLKELQSVVPTDREVEIGELLPVDAEGEGWLIDPERLAILLHASPEDLLEFREELRERYQERQAQAEGRREARRERIHKAGHRTSKTREKSVSEEAYGETKPHADRVSVEDEEPPGMNRMENRTQKDKRRTEERNHTLRKEPSKSTEKKETSKNNRKRERSRSNRPAEEPYQPRHMKPESDDRQKDKKRPAHANSSVPKRK